MRRSLRPSVVAVLAAAAMLTVTACGSSSSGGASSSASASASSGGGATASSSSAATKGSIKVGYIAQNENNQYNVDAANAFKSWATKLGETPTVVNGNDDQTTQDTQADQMITEGVKAVSVEFSDPALACTAVNKMRAAGIKVISISSPISGCDIDYLLSRNDTEDAKQAIEAGLKAHPSGDWVLMWGDPDNPVAQQWRAEGEKLLKPYVSSGKIKLVSDAWDPNWDAATAQTRAEADLSASKDAVKVFIVNNDAMALGVLAAVKHANLAGKVWISGHDGDAPNLDAMLGNQFNWDQWVNGPLDGKLAAQASLALVNGTALPAGTGKEPNGKYSVAGQAEPETVLPSAESIGPWFCSYHYYPKSVLYAGALSSQAPSCS